MTASTAARPESLRAVIGSRLIERPTTTHEYDDKSERRGEQAKSTADHRGAVPCSDAGKGGVVMARDRCSECCRRLVASDPGSDRYTCPHCGASYTEEELMDQ